MTQVNWYLAACKPRQEKRASEHLDNQGIEYFLPEITVEKKRQGKVISQIEPLFPGYIFIQLDDDHPLWSKVRSTRGLRDFVRFAGKPGRVPSSLIAQLKEGYSEEEAPKISMLPKPGEAIRIKHGPFAGLEAIFETLDGNERAIILLNLLGKEQRLAVSLKDVE